MSDSIGLIIFIIVLFINVVGLLFDAYLFFNEMTTITMYVKSVPILGIPILFLQIVGFGGLVEHFYGHLFK